MPESTGAALTGLAGVVGQEKVARSLEYLQGEVDRLRTPISLGWALLGLAAWEAWPANGHALVERCLANQSRYGEYDTSALCLLFLGAFAGEANRIHTLFLANSCGNRVPAIVVSVRSSMADHVRSTKSEWRPDATRCAPGRGSWCCDRIRIAPGSEAVFPDAATGASVRGEESPTTSWILPMHYQGDSGAGCLSRGIEGQANSAEAESRRNCVGGASHQYASSRSAWGD